MVWILNMLPAKHTPHIRMNVIFGKMIFSGKNVNDNSPAADLSRFRLLEGLPRRFGGCPLWWVSCIQISKFNAKKISSFNKEYSLIVKIPNDLILCVPLDLWIWRMDSASVGMKFAWINSLFQPPLLEKKKNKPLHDLAGKETLEEAHNATL